VKEVRGVLVYAPFLPEKRDAVAGVLEGAGIRAVESEPDMVVAVGGDGTFLKCFNQFHAPVLAVNAGHLGFLSSCDEKELPRAVAMLASGTYDIQELPRLQAGLPQGAVHTALNDVCIHRCSDYGLLHLGIRVNGQSAAIMTGDGVLVSTAMGSTAYSLSCGGPILHPNIPAMVITPVCPHLLSLRPIVIPADASVSITLLGPGDRALVSPDGRQIGCVLADGQGAVITRAPENSLLVRLPGGEGYYSRLGRKLGWSYRG
jgi:NAD+ kinase